MKNKSSKNVGIVRERERERESSNLKKRRKKIIISILLLIIAILAVIMVQKNKNSQLKEIGEATKQEELVQKIKRKVTVLKVEGEKIYGTIKFESTIENLEYIMTPEENQIKLEKQTRQLAIDYELQNKQEYKFKVKAKENEEEEIIIQIDKEDIPEVEIKQEQYATITTGGIKLDRTISIKQTERYKTVYSLDNGENWEEYTKEVKTNQIPNAVIAQKVSIDEESQDAIVIEKYEKMPDLAQDAIRIPAYDYNEETIEVTNGIKYIKVEEAMEGFKIQVTGSYSVTFMQEDKKTNVSGTNSRQGDKIIVPQKARYIGINGNIREIKVVPSVQAKITHVGQTTIELEAKSNGYSEDVTYEYYLNGVRKALDEQNTYKYTGLTAFVSYNIEVKAKDVKGNIDTVSHTIKTKAENKSIVGFITSDAINPNQKIYTNKISNVTYGYEVLYLDKNNLPSQVKYTSSTNTYTITNSISIGTSQTSKMAVLKCDGNLTINPGVIITTATYEKERKGYPRGKNNGEDTIKANVTNLKGLFICCMGTLTNNGTITQTARGTHNTSGENVYLWYNGNETYEYVPAYGGWGSSNNANRNGNNGTNRATGGGGKGSLRGDGSHGGNGSQGTSYSGGSGGGGGSGSIYDGYSSGAAGLGNGGEGRKWSKKRNILFWWRSWHYRRFFCTSSYSR